MAAVDFTKNTLVIITGASQGIGQTICSEIAKRCADSAFVLIARSQNGLNETKSLVMTANKNAIVDIHPLDLSKSTNADYESIITDLLQKKKTFEQTLLIHNAGQTGDLKKALELNDQNAWTSYYQLNFISVALMNAVFIKKLSGITQKLFVINITSLCGRTPFANLAMYGSGKAARELYFKVLAVEEPNLVVLNYSPGPVDTDMFNGIITNAQDPELKKTFSEMKSSKRVLSTGQTVDKLLRILTEGDFNSGDTIDYFDKA